jgi:hypothetical protein
VELCSADSKKRGKKLRDVTESEQTQSTESSDNESFLRDTMRLLENFSHRARTQKEGSRVPKAGTQKCTAEKLNFRNAREGHALVVSSGAVKDKGFSPEGISFNG